MYILSLAADSYLTRYNKSEFDVGSQLKIHHSSFIYSSPFFVHMTHMWQFLLLFFSVSHLHYPGTLNNGYAVLVKRRATTLLVIHNALHGAGPGPGPGSTFGAERERKSKGTQFDCVKKERNLRSETVVCLEGEGWERGWGWVRARMTHPFHAWYVSCKLKVTSCYQARRSMLTG